MNSYSVALAWNTSSDNHFDNLPLVYNVHALYAMMLKMCKKKKCKWMITFLIFTTWLNKRSHTGCITNKQHNNVDIHGDFTSTLFKSAVVQFCVIMAEVSPLKTYCEKATITAGCQQSWWRSHPQSPAAIKNFVSSGRGSFASLCKISNYTMIVLKVV